MMQCVSFLARRNRHASHSVRVARTHTSVKSLFGLVVALRSETVSKSHRSFSHEKENVAVTSEASSRTCTPLLAHSMHIPVICWLRRHRVLCFLFSACLKFQKYVKCTVTTFLGASVNRVRKWEQAERSIGQVSRTVRKLTLDFVCALRAPT